MKTIVWDVDDVLNELMKEWFTQSGLPEDRPGVFPYADLRENPPDRLLGVSRQAYLDSLDRFRLSDAAERMTPPTELLAWFSKYGGSFHHLALTATPRLAAEKSAAWVCRHFGTWIRSFHFVPSARESEKLPSYHRTKEDFLRWWGRADILVDDAPHNLDAARRLGILAVCRPQPWNDGRHSLAETLSLLADMR